MKIQPYYNQILVRPNKINYESKGGILATETQTRAVNMQTGEVVAVGHGMITPEGNLAPLQTKVGDTVMFLRGTGVQVKYAVDCEELFMFKEMELFGLIPATLEQKAEKILAKD